MFKKYVSFYTILCAHVFALSCTDQDAYAPKSIRAHSLNLNAVMHASPFLDAERYCSQCHGLGLVGGESGEPSCYQCHGKTWTDDVDAYGSAVVPVDHIEKNGRFFHNPAHATAEQTCSVCHGSQLEGAGDSGPPPCLLCHENLWN